MVRIMLDSAFVIDHFHGQLEAVRRYERIFEDGDEPLVNEVIVCEVRAGLRDEDLPVLQAFMEPVEFVQPPPEAAMLAGEWRAAARRDGRTLSLADALIAAAANYDGATVLTRNLSDFALTPVRVETY